MVSEEEIIETDRLLCLLAKRDGYKFGYLGLDESFWAELASEALRKALKSYDPGKGATLKTYTIYVVYARRRIDVLRKKWPILVSFESLAEKHRRKGEGSSPGWPHTPLNPVTETVDAQVKRRLYICIQRLPERNRQILCKSYGLCGETRLTRKEIADGFGVTPPRISQIVRESRSFLRTCLSTGV